MLDIDTDMCEVETPQSDGGFKSKTFLVWESFRTLKNLYFSLANMEFCYAVQLPVNFQSYPGIAGLYETVWPFVSLR